MLRKISPDAKLLSDLSEVTRANSALAKQTEGDHGDLKFYQSGDGKRRYLRVCETLKAPEGPARYEFTFYEVRPPLGVEANPAPAILLVK